MPKIFKFILVLCLFFSGNAEAQFWKKKKAKSKEETFDGAGRLGYDKFHHSFFEGMREYGLENFDKSIEEFEKCLQMDPKSVAVYFQMSRVYNEMGQKSMAISSAQKSFELEKGNKDLYHNYKELCLNSRKFNDAISATKQFIGTLENGSEVIKYKKELARLYEYNRETSDAVLVYNELEEEFGYSNAYADERLRLYKQMNKLDEALTEVDGLIQNNLGVAGYLYQKASLLNEKGNETEALNYYDKALDAKVSHSKALIESGELLIKNGDETKGLERIKKAFLNNELDVRDKINAFNRLNSRINSKSTMLELAKVLQQTHENESGANKALSDAYFELGDKKLGVQYLAIAKEIEPNNFNYSVDLVNTYYELGDYENLLKWSVQATELYPSHHIFYLYAGIAFSELGDYNNALMMLETGKNYVIGNNSAKYDFKLSLADVYYNMGEYNEAEMVYEELLTEQPNNATALNNYAYFLARRAYKLRDAENMVKKAIEIDGENASYLDTYGWVLFSGEKYETAITYFDKALKFSPNSAEILEHKGDALFKLGKVDTALEFWKNAEENGGKSKKLLKKIDNKKYYEE